MSSSVSEETDALTATVTLAYRRLDNGTGALSLKSALIRREISTIETGDERPENGSVTINLWDFYRFVESCKDITLFLSIGQKSLEAGTYYNSDLGWFELSSEFSAVVELPATTTESDDSMTVIFDNSECWVVANFLWLDKIKAFTVANRNDKTVMQCAGSGFRQVLTPNEVRTIGGPSVAIPSDFFTSVIGAGVPGDMSMVSIGGMIRCSIGDFDMSSTTGVIESVEIPKIADDAIPYFVIDASEADQIGKTIWEASRHFGSQDIQISRVDDKTAKWEISKDGCNISVMVRCAMTGTKTIRVNAGYLIRSMASCQVDAVAVHLIEDMGKLLVSYTNRMVTNSILIDAAIE
jgi:hypothetical protein